VPKRQPKTITFEVTVPVLDKRILPEEEQKLANLEIGHQLLKLRKAGFNHYEILEQTNIAVRRQKEILKEWQQEMNADCQDIVAEWRQVAMARLEDVIKIAATKAQFSDDPDRLLLTIIRATEAQGKIMGVDKSATTNNTQINITPLQQEALKRLGYG
jgi:hypothetical protein